MSERRERGIAVFAESFGVSADELPTAMAERVGALYAEEAIFAAGGPAWNDPALPDQHRSVAILTALICEGVLGNRLEAHLQRAVRAGLDQRAIELMVLVLAIYVGQEKTSIAAEEIQRFFRTRGTGTATTKPQTAS